MQNDRASSRLRQYKRSLIFPAFFGLLLVAGSVGPNVKSLVVADETAWQHALIPGRWSNAAEPTLRRHRGFVWLRCSVKVPSSWKDRRVQLLVSQVAEVHEAYCNGQRVGQAGKFPPQFADGSGENPRHEIPASAIRFGGTNTITLRVYSRNAEGGFSGQAPVLIAGKNGIALNGRWEFRLGDHLDWASEPVQQTTTAIFWRNMSTADALKIAQRTKGLTPAESLAAMTVPADLQIETVLAEPTITQPVFMTFDTAGRLWVVEYRQYPYPAGLKLVSKDKFWRAVYDRVPKPPPHGPKGVDRISIHSDTNGDGQIDQHQVFLDNLNIASACAVAEDGVWVLNPPYLLFYADRNRDEKPDGPPEVHLEGFGLEDTHSVVNSLRFGPDGWLYGAQGSTVSGNVRRPGAKKTTYSMGQLIWRYHPRHKIYEVFAEGGGNAFGVEIDRLGQLFSGHNGGNTRGFHYIQGGYYRKGFGKHGPLSNPYTFGYFEAMQHAAVPRFTHNFILYEAQQFPKKYRGRLFGIEPLQGRVVMSSIMPLGSTWKTEDLGFPVTTRDRQFRPVDIKLGPDGAIYIADFHEPQISHSEHFSGQIEKNTGRIYRLKDRTQAMQSPSIKSMPTSELIETLKNPNRTIRQLVVQELTTRTDENLNSRLREELHQPELNPTLDALWVLYQREDFDEAVWSLAARHSHPVVRTWATRLLTDIPGHLPDFAPAALVTTAKNAATPGERSQLAASARRVPVDVTLEILAVLLARDEDLNDPHIPLSLWWALETHAEAHRTEILDWLSSPAGPWSQAMFRKHLAGRLMQRYAASGTRQDFLTCAKLLQLAPNDECRQLLLAGFEDGTRNRSLGNLPDELINAIVKAGGGSFTLQLRQGQAAAIKTALEQVASDQMTASKRVELIHVLGTLKQPELAGNLLQLADPKQPIPVQQAALNALRGFVKETIAEQVVKNYSKYSMESQQAAAMLLASRAAWAKQLLAAIDNRHIKKSTIPIDAVYQMSIHQDLTLQQALGRHWGNLNDSEDAERQRELASYQQVLKSGFGNPAVGKQLFNKTCAKCHLLFGEGGRIGPELTAYNRDDTQRMLKNIVNPSVEIREGFESYLILTDDGQTASGFLFDEDQRVIVLRGVDGQNVTISRESILQQKKQTRSLMPAGLLKDYTAQQVRDLFSYLRSAQPLN